MFKNICAVLEERKVEYRVGTAGGGNQVLQPYLQNVENFKIIGSLTNASHIHNFGLYVGNHTDLTEEKIVALCGAVNEA
jgi:CDP-6-deoxy-D-xylo-4-hexulose-3-dehydrase